MNVQTNSSQLTPEQVKKGYNRMFKRAPDSDAVVSDCISKYKTYDDMIFAFANSAEFRRLLQARFARNHEFKLECLLLVGTHHKTGTRWMADIFKTISRYLNLKYFNGSSKYLDGSEEVFFQIVSRFGPALEKNYRGLHIIRDPRDVIISGANYHDQTAEKSWLFKPSRKFGGKSYQEMIRSYPNYFDKLLFEMDNIGKGTITDMRNWNYLDNNFVNVKYEDLIKDSDLEEFSKIFQFLGLGGIALPLCLDIAWAGSIFSGRVKKSGGHIRSGKPQQWRSVFSRSLANQFLSRYGDILVALGYETDDSWIDLCEG